MDQCEDCGGTGYQQDDDEEDSGITREPGPMSIWDKAEAAAARAPDWIRPHIAHLVAEWNEKRLLREAEKRDAAKGYSP